MESLAERGLPAAELNSTVSASRRAEALSALAERALEFVFVAPEQLANDDSRTALAAAKPSLVAVDEAHCVSEWGHDFRPDYLRLGSLVEELGRPRVLALTATAAPPVRREIVERLGLRDPEVVVRGFDRPNVWLGVERFHDEAAKDEALRARVAEAEKPGIVYVATRRAADEVAEALRERGIDAKAYHVGLKASEREAVQQAFTDDEIEVIVSTIAFGMGVDKPNVRFVFHRDVADSIDAYYQELGRAGRDGAPARAILFYRPEDVGLRRFFAGNAQLDVDELEEVVETVTARAAPVEREELEAGEGVSASTLGAGLRRLQDAGAVEVLADGDVARGDEADARATARDAVRAQERHADWERSRVEMMRGYAELRDCRREYLLNYFGEQFEAPCGRCDNCEAGIVEPDAEQPFPLGTRVAHATWGEGLVQRYERDKVVVLFDEAGYKTLDVGLVRERGLLDVAP